MSRTAEATMDILGIVLIAMGKVTLNGDKITIDCVDNGCALDDAIRYGYIYGLGRGQWNPTHLGLRLVREWCGPDGIPRQDIAEWIKHEIL